MPTGSERLRMCFHGVGIIRTAAWFVSLLGGIWAHRPRGWRILEGNAWSALLWRSDMLLVLALKPCTRLQGRILSAYAPHVSPDSICPLVHYQVFSYTSRALSCCTGFQLLVHPLVYFQLFHRATGLGVSFF